MCGIVGIYNLHGAPVSKEALLAMTKKIAHRGPDDEGICIEGPVGLGSRRLSIIDVSSRGHQPMQNQDGTVYLAYNGEVYNFKELRSELEQLGHRFISDTDTEVVLKSYEQWGQCCVEKFNGMFAFAIFDKKNQQLFLSRDRLGKKPLYYYQDSAIVVFASEIKAILEHPQVKRQVNPMGMVNYFTFGHSIGPDTMFLGIKKLLPGHSLVIDKGSAIVSQYWDSFIKEDGKDRGKKYYQEAIYELFSDAVKKRLVADVPLGVFLSGGVDSSSVLAMMAKYQSSPVNTFSVGFNVGGREFNELSDAKLVADHFGARHHELVLEEKDLSDNLEKIIYHFDEPFGDAANFPVFCISKYASQHVKVVLSGEGGDEIFGGYRRYMIEKNLSLFSPLRYLIKIPGVNALINSQSQLKKIRQLAQSLPIKDDLARQTNWLVCFSRDMLNQLFLVDHGAIDPLARYKEFNALHENSDRLANMMYLDQKILLSDGYLEKVDKATMAFGLEARTPFLDYRLVEFANAMPAKYKINGLTTKYIFKEAMAGLLPPAILKKGKQGFAVPLNIWFRGKLKNYVQEILFDARTRSRPYFNVSYIENLWQRYQEVGEPMSYQLWLLLNFELWHREFIDKQ